MSKKEVNGAWPTPPSKGHDAPSRHEQSPDEGGGPVAVPVDFLPVGEGMPPWIDIPGVCKEARRFVALHALSQFNVVAINDGQRVFTTSDRDGEFRRFFRRIMGDRGTDRQYAENATIVYDCEQQRQWLAPRPSAIQFLNLQF